MTDAAFCPMCGTQRQPGMSFCGKCGYDYGSTPASPAGTMQARGSIQGGVAGGMYELEQLRVKLMIGRLLTVAVVLAVWWWAIPIIKDPLALIATFLLALFGGIWLGTMLTLNLLRSR